MKPVPVASPCIGVCVLDAASVCGGCGRHIDEIAAWSLADETRRAEIVERALQRRVLASGHRPEPESRS